MMTIENSKQDKKERYENLRSRIDTYKPAWDKYGVIQYKSEHIAILQRRTGMQVELAFDDLPKEGYRLMALDERESSGEYFYFQSMKFIVSTSY
jgi:hypothetical protein